MTLTCQQLLIMRPGNIPFLQFVKRKGRNNMASRLSWSGDRRRPIKDLQSNVRTYFIKKSRNVWIRELLESLFDSFFPDLSTFVIEHQITNNRLNNINSAKVDKFFFEAVVNDVAVFKDTRILSQIREAQKYIFVFQ